MIAQLAHIAAAALFLSSAARTPLAQTPDWMLGPFTKPQGLGPILTPDATATFHSKSGAILCRIVGDRLIATKVNGK